MVSGFDECFPGLFPVESWEARPARSINLRIRSDPSYPRPVSFPRPNHALGETILPLQSRKYLTQVSKIAREAVRRSQKPPPETTAGIPPTTQLKTEKKNQITAGG